MAIIAVVAVLTAGIITIPMVSADRFDNKINELQNQNDSNQEKVDDLELKAQSLEDAIAKLKKQIETLQKQIAKNQKESDRLKNEIAEAEVELEKQQNILGQNIRAMYLEGQISTIEMLATSKDLSQFVDRQQYRDVVKDKIKAQVDKITELKLALKAQRDEVERLIKEDQALKKQISSQKAERNRLLGLNRDEQEAYNSKIASNNDRIAELRRQQYLENIRLFGGSGGQIGGGGYPWGYATCLHTGQVDGACYNYDWQVGGSIWNWATGGYGYRNCTDWVAWRTGAPGGLGNANQWDNRAPSFGFTVSHTPRVGAAAVSNSGFYGHVMYVEAVHGDGTITVSDYNRAGTGKYDINRINIGSLVFVYL